MLNSEVKINEHYLANVSNKKAVIKIDLPMFSDYGQLQQGWLATNMNTQRGIKVKSGRRLLRHIPTNLLNNYLEIYK